MSHLRTSCNGYSVADLGGKEKRRNRSQIVGLMVKGKVSPNSPSFRG